MVILEALEAILELDYELESLAIARPPKTEAFLRKYGDRYGTAKKPKGQPPSTEKLRS